MLQPKIDPKQQRRVAEIVQWASAFHTVFVTGPFRSGTGIMAHILCEQLERPIYDDYYGLLHNLLMCWKVQRSEEKIVGWVPSQFFNSHRLAQDDCNTGVIVMVRCSKDIDSSLQKLGGLDRTNIMDRAVYSVPPNYKGSLAQYKYDYWREKQRHRIKNLLEVKYPDDLEFGHKFWATEHQRLYMKYKQVVPTSNDSINVAINMRYRNETANDEPTYRRETANV